MKFIKAPILLIACAAIALLSSCSKNETATIQGVVYSLNGQQRISQAHVYVDDKGSGYETHSAVDGSFSFDVPSGKHTLYIETGDGNIFKTALDLNLSKGQTLVLDNSQTVLRQRGMLACIQGSFDQIESIVHDSLGYTIDTLQPNDLDVASNLSGYSALFVNCGAPAITQAAYTNLGNFVSGGHSMYVSDYGVDYLLGYYDGSCAPVGGFIPDSVLCTNRSATSAMTLPGVNITSTALATYMGTSTVTIDYDLGGWGMVALYNSGFWDVMMSSPSMGPLLLHTNHYGGLGAGNIYFTTFHNKPNGTISSTAEQLLTYVILNL